MYYNTTNLTGLRLQAATNKNQSQTNAIKAIFKENQEYWFTWFQIQDIFIDQNWQVSESSIKRAISDLFRKEKALIQSKERVTGKWANAPVFQHKFKGSQNSLF